MTNSTIAQAPIAKTLPLSRLGTIMGAFSQADGSEVVECDIGSGIMIGRKERQEEMEMEEEDDESTSRSRFAVLTRNPEPLLSNAYK